MNFVYSLSFYLAISTVYCTVEFGKIDPQTQWAYEGSSVEFTCFSTTEPRWLKDGFIIKPVWIIPNVSYTIQLKNVQSSDSGIYQCRGTRLHSDDMFLAVCKLSVGVNKPNAVSPTIAKQEVHSAASFSCSSKGLVTWYFESYDKHTKYFVSNRKEIKINPVQLKYGGYYFCFGQVEDEARNFLSRAELRVYEQTRIKPTALTLVEYSDGKFECESMIKPKWTFHNGKFRTVLGDKSKTLFIKMCTKEDEGIYTCEGLTNNGHTFFAEGSLIVSDMRNNSISPSFQIARTHDIVKILCKSYSKVHWQFNGQDVPPSAIVYENDVIPLQWLLIENAGVHNAGIYSCSGGERNEYFHEESTLTIIAKSSRIHPPHLNGKLGQTVQFQCTSIHNVTWYFNESLLIENSEFQFIESFRDHLLIINNVQPHHTGEYTCLGQEQRYLLLESIGLLYVNEDLKVVPSYQEAMVGDIVSFTCFFRGQVYWRYYGQQLPPNTEESKWNDKNWITIKGVGLKDSGVYYCYSVLHKNFIATGQLLVKKRRTSTCPRLPQVDYGVLIVSGNTVGSTASVLCDSDRTSNSHQFRVCLSTGEWSGSQQVCLKNLEYSGSKNNFNSMFFLVASIFLLLFIYSTINT